MTNHLKIFRNLYFVGLLFFQNRVLAQSSEKTPLWEVLANEVSRLLPTGEGSWGRDWSRANKEFGSALAVSSHLTSFGPTYLAATLVESAMTPFTLAGKTLNDSSKKSEVEKREEEANERDRENERLRKENEELRKKQAELIEKIQNQAERFIDSYNPETKVGVIEPELKQILEIAKSDVLKFYSVCFELSGFSEIQKTRGIETVRKELSDFEIATQFLKNQLEVM